jgi:SAM-dependent methyltransferase
MRRRREWDELGDADPFWAVLTRPENKFGGVDREAFFASGIETIDRVLATAQGLGLPVRRDAALDFGCGLGRLTRALAREFGRAHGVDVSRSLIAQAEELNRDVPNCDFQLLDRDDLGTIESGSIDLVCSFLVLQHQARRDAIRRYIGEFIRVLRDGGAAVFQIPTHIPWRNRIQPRRRLYWLLRRGGASPRVLYERLGLDPLRMLHMPRGEVFDAIERGGGSLLIVVEDTLSDVYPSATYYVTRRGTQASELGASGRA